MKIAVFGLGYVGLTSCGCLIKQGHEVFGIEPNEEKIAQIRSGKAPIFEPGLDDLLALGISSNRLQVSHKVDDRLDRCDLALVCVGTPSGVDGAHNMAFIAEVSRQIAAQVKVSNTRLTVVYRSTFRPGTIENLIRPVFAATLRDKISNVELIYNPEFLRESVAIRDYFEPPKIVIGTSDGRTSRIIEELYQDMDCPRFFTSYRVAEITKFVDNSFHALKVAFANEVGRVCGQLDIDMHRVHEIFVSDTKLNISAHYLRPGGPFGGSCLPKDVRALSYIAEDVGAETFVVDSLLKSNEAHKRFLFGKITDGLNKGDSILLLGLAFKANSDDLRESPHIDLARKVIQAGFRLSIYDPNVDPRKLLGANLGYAYANLPSIEQLLVDQQTVEATEFDLVVDTGNWTSKLALRAKAVFDTNRLQRI